MQIPFIIIIIVVVVISFYLLSREKLNSKRFGNKVHPLTYRSIQYRFFCHVSNLSAHRIRHVELRSFRHVFTLARLQMYICL